MAKWILDFGERFPLASNEMFEMRKEERSSRRRADNAAFQRVWDEVGGLPQGESHKRRVTIICDFRLMIHAYDPDAFFKTTHDSLVACGALVDDSLLYLVIGSPVFQLSGFNNFRVEVEDVE